MKNATISVELLKSSVCSSLTSHSTHYRSFQDNFTEGWWLVNQIKGQSYQAQLTKR